MITLDNGADIYFTRLQQRKTPAESPCVKTTYGTLTTWDTVKKIRGNRVKLVLMLQTLLQNTKPGGHAIYLC